MKQFESDVDKFQNLNNLLSGKYNNQSLLPKQSIKFRPFANRQNVLNFDISQPERLKSTFSSLNRHQPPSPV